MKNLLATVLVLGFVPSAFGAPVYCFSNSEENKYSVSINNKWTSAKIELNGEALTFGQLACSSPESDTDALLYCHSTGVADAGFSTALVKDKSGDLKLELSAITFFGSNSIDTLTCVAAQH
jgi:hypothetical protein